MLERRIAGPPHEGRQVMDEERCHDARQVLRGLSPDGQDHLLVADPLVLHGRSHVAMRADPSVKRVAARLVIGDQHDGPRGMAHAQAHERLHHPLRGVRTHHGDDQVEDRCAGVRQALLGDPRLAVGGGGGRRGLRSSPQASELGFDGLHIGALRLPDGRGEALRVAELHETAMDREFALRGGSGCHLSAAYSRRQVRPSRSSSSSAAGGPQVPAP